VGHVITIHRAIEVSRECGYPFSIFACQPWTPDSAAIICYVDLETELPSTVEGFNYFLGCDIVNEFLEGCRDMTPAQQTERVIYYAIHDA
jgi:hypothetical protein